MAGSVYTGPLLICEASGVTNDSLTGAVTFTGMAGSLYTVWPASNEGDTGCESVTISLESADSILGIITSEASFSVTGLTKDSWATLDSSFCTLLISSLTLSLVATVTPLLLKVTVWLSKISSSLKGSCVVSSLSPAIFWSSLGKNTPWTSK